MKNMKLTITGCRISKNGSIITSIEKEALTRYNYLGSCTKKDGIYYYHIYNNNNNYYGKFSILRK